MANINILEIKAKAKSLEPVVRIGKNGMNDSVIQEIEKLLKKRKLIKIKMLNNCPPEERDNIIERSVSETNSILIDKLGNVFVLYREK